MSTTLLDQIDTYFAQIDDEQGPIKADDVAVLLDHVTELPVIATPLRERPRWWIAGTAAAAVALMIGIIALAVPRSEDQPVTEPSTVTTTTSVDATPSTTLPSAEPDTAPADVVAGAAQHSLLAERAPTVTDLPNSGTAGWRVYDGNIGFETSVAFGAGGVDEALWQFHDGYGCSYDGGFLHADGCHAFWDEGTTPSWDEGPMAFRAFEDPEERFYVSDDGLTWTETEFRGFPGMAVSRMIVDMGAPIVEVGTARDVADTEWAAMNNGPWSALGERRLFTTQDGSDWYELDPRARILSSPLVRVGDTIATTGHLTTACPDSPCETTFLYSIDGGRTFAEADTGSFAFGQRSHMIYKSNGALYTLTWTDSRGTWADFRLLTSSDGQRWTNYGQVDLGPVEADPATNAYTHAATRAVHVLGDGTVVFRSGSEIQVSLDSGRTWLPATGIPIESDGETFESEFATVSGGWLWLTRDGLSIATDGTRWVQLRTPARPEAGIVQVFTDGGQAFLAPPRR